MPLGQRNITKRTRNVQDVPRRAQRPLISSVPGASPTHASSTQWIDCLTETNPEDLPATILKILVQGRATNKNPEQSRKVPEHGIIVGHSVTPRMTIRFSTKRVSIGRQKDPSTSNRKLHTSFCRVTVNLIWTSVGRTASSFVKSTTNVMLTTVVRHSYPFAVFVTAEAKYTGMTGPLLQQRMMTEPPGGYPSQILSCILTCCWWCGGEWNKNIWLGCSVLWQAYWSRILSLHWVVLQYRLFCSLCHLTRLPILCACQFGGWW